MQQPACIQLVMVRPSNLSHCTALVKPTPTSRVEWVPDDLLWESHKKKVGSAALKGKLGVELPTEV